MPRIPELSSGNAKPLPDTAMMCAPVGKFQGNDTMKLHDLSLLHGPAILALNNQHETETSRLDEAGLASLLQMAFYAKGIDEGKTALLIALDQRAPYANPNFDWFKARYGSFIYIDRVIVSAEARGQGLASALYLDLFAAASRAGQCRVVCEVNIDPPNPASQAFHVVLGFEVVGEAKIHGGKKTVCYLEKPLKAVRTGHGG
jgi:hypothetical protein